MTRVIDAENLVKRYGELLALDRFSLTLDKGEILGLLGPNGSGKTTAINCILSLLKTDKGSVSIFGSEMSPANYAVKAKIGIVPQQIAVFEELSVYENIDYFCGLYVADKNKRRRLVEEALEFAELKNFVKFTPKKLSGGLKRRLNIACGTAHEPELIVLDEPTVAVDPQSRAHILSGIEKMRDRGVSVIYTTHYMEEVEQICTRVVIMDKGKAIASDTVQQLKDMIRTGETVKIETADVSPEDIEDLKAVKNVYAVTFENDILTLKCEKGMHNLVHILRVLEQKNIPFGQVESTRPTLNDVFLEITGRELRDAEETK